MWSRVLEVVLGCWLLMSPFIFAYAEDEPGIRANDLVCGAAVIVLGLLSWWRPTELAHLLSLAVGGWLIGFAYVQGFGSVSPASQNHMIVGLLLLMFAVIPNNASRPPAGWEDYRMRQANQ